MSLSGRTGKKQICLPTPSTPAEAMDESGLRKENETCELSKLS